MKSILPTNENNINNITSYMGMRHKRWYVMYAAASMLGGLLLVSTVFPTAAQVNRSNPNVAGQGDGRLLSGAGSSRQIQGTPHGMILKRQIDEALTGALNNYFDPATWLLDVSVDVAMRTYREEVPISAVREEPFRIDEDLPGLPFIPRNMRRELGASREQDDEENAEVREIQVPEVDRIRIVLWADSSYEAEALALMRQVVEAKVRLDQDRGDTFELMQQRFRTGKDPLGADEAGLEPYMYPLAAIVLLLGLLFGLLIWYLTVFLPRQKEGKVSSETTPPSSFPEVPEQGLSPNGPSSSKGMLSSSDEEYAAVDADPKNYLMQIFLHHPEQFGRLFSYWYENDREEGIRQAAAIVRSIDPKLLGMLQETISVEAFRKLEEAMNMPQLYPYSKTEGLLRQLAEQLRARHRQFGQNDNFSVLPSFDFLHYTDDEKLLQVIRPESERVKALVLSHLPENRKSKLLQAFGVEEGGRILVCLPQVRNMAYDEYEKIASHLFAQCKDVAESGEFVTGRDIDQIVSVIESLPASEQEKYIQQLELADPDLAETVGERVITMERISELGDETLEQAVDAMSREDLAFALVDSDEQLRTRLLRFRPDREEELIRQEMEELGFLSSGETDRARAKLLDRLRRIHKNKIQNRDTTVSG